MRVNEKENLFLIDRDYEIWGIEEEELAGTAFASLVPFAVLSVVVSPFMLGVTPFFWLGLLVALKSYKSRNNVRGLVKRKFLVGLEKLVKRNVYYA